MLVQYDGPHPSVDIDATGQYDIARGAPIEIEDEVAKSLLQQSTWSKAKAPVTTTPKGGTA